MSPHNSQCANGYSVRLSKSLAEKYQWAKDKRKDISTNVSVGLMEDAIRAVHLEMNRVALDSEMVPKHSRHDDLADPAVETGMFFIKVERNDTLHDVRISASANYNTCVVTITSIAAG